MFFFLPSGSLRDVDNVKEEDCRNDKIIHKLLNWSETGNIVVKDKKNQNLSAIRIINVFSSFLQKNKLVKLTDATASHLKLSMTH